MRGEKCSFERVSKKAVFPEEILFLRLSYLPAGRRTKCKTSKKRISFGEAVTACIFVELFRHPLS